MSKDRILGAIAVVALIAGLYYLSGIVFGEPDARVPDVGEPPEQQDASSPPLEGAARVIHDHEIQVAFHEERAQGWLDFGHAASLHLNLARLTGRPEHYGLAEQDIVKGFEAAVPSSGPLAQAAAVAFTMHKFADADAHLDAIEGGAIVNRETATMVAAMRADLDLARGRYAEAEQAITALLEQERSVTNLQRLANLKSQIGQPGEADAALEEAIGIARIDRAYNTAFMELRRGLLDLDHERYSEARVHYERANESFPNWYLVEEHLAEILCLLDECERAVEIYADVVERTGSPELMGSYAETLEKLGREDEAEPWRTRSDAEWDRLVEQYPEALGGHGLEHFLERSEPERALALARRNIELRADGEARVLLVRALMGVEEFDEAEQVLADTLESPYRTPGLFEVAAELATRTGDEEGANAHQQVRREMIEHFAAQSDGDDETSP